LGASGNFLPAGGIICGERPEAQFTVPPLSAVTRLHNAMVSGFRNAGETILGMLLFLAEYGLTLVIWLAILTVPVFLRWKRYRRSLAWL
jgi:hypothetical protein